MDNLNDVLKAWDEGATTQTRVSRDCAQSVNNPDLTPFDKVKLAGEVARAAAPHIRRILKDAPSDWREDIYHHEIPAHIRPFVIGYCADRGIRVRFARGAAGGELAKIARIGADQ